MIGWQFFVSNLLDATTYDSLAFAQSSTFVDFFEFSVQHNGELWLFGELSVQVWYDTGDPTEPFSPRLGAVMRPGVASPKTIVELDGSIFFLGLDKVVYRTVGYAIKRVSTHALEELLGAGDGGYTRGMTACGFEHHGHSFYALSVLPLLGTFVYDCSTDKWHERCRASNGFGPWQINTATQLSTRLLLGDAVNGNLYHMDSSVVTEAGNVVPRIAVLPPLLRHGPRVFMSRLEVEMEVGTGGAPGTLAVDWSDDGCLNWTAAPRLLSTGAAGATRTRVATTRLGSFRQRLLRLTAQGPATIYAVDVDVPSRSASDG